tara:strand:+ start:206 stop:1468 length:1263 start_codon:yes stop_codon:yes gene_type:complete
MSDEKDSDKKVRIAAVSNEDNSHLSNAELNKLYPNTYKGVAKVAGLDRPHMVIDVPTGHYGIDIKGDEETTLIQNPPEKPFTINDYSQLLQSIGDHKAVERLNKAAQDALTEEGIKMTEDFQLIKRKDMINAEAKVAEQAAERKEETAKEERRRKSRELAEEYNRKQAAGEDLSDFQGNTDPNSIQGQEQAREQQGLDIAMRPKLAVNVMRVQFPLEVIDELNSHIDDTIIPNNVDYSPVLVGQIRQNEKSKQLYFPHEGDDVGEQFSSVLLRLASEYVDRTIGLPCDVDMQSMWTVHSYEGDYNPVHDHGTRTPMGLSMILYLKVPPQISELDNPSEKFDGLNQSSGAVDGFTYLVWGVNGMRDTNILRPLTEEYVKPEVGTMLMFPAWLRHGVNPFFGEGERRTMSANINITPKEKVT